MNGVELAKLNMYAIILTTLKRYKTVWEGNVFFAGKVAELIAKIAAIHKAAEVQTGDTTGGTDDKRDRRIELEEAALSVARIMRSYSASIKNGILYDEVYHTPTSLKKSTAANLLYNTGQLHKLATDNLAGAASCGLTQELLDDLLAKKTEFLKWSDAPAIERKLKKDATATIKRLFKESDEIIKDHLDNGMDSYKTIQHSLHNDYFNGRPIIDPPTIKLAMRCKIVDSDTKMPIVGAKVVIKDHNINRKSTPKGQLLVRNLKEGNHTVTVSLEGYAPQAVKAIYKTGETTFVSIEMVKKV